MQKTLSRTIWGSDQSTHVYMQLHGYLNICAVLEQKDYGMALFLDLKKAFDTVDHHILMIKLEK